MRNFLPFILVAACGGATSSTPISKSSGEPAGEQTETTGSEPSLATQPGPAPQAGVAPKSGKESEAPSLTLSDRKLVAELEADMVEFARVVKAAGTDCVQIAKAIDGHVESNGQLLRTLSAEVDDASADKKDMLDRELQSRLGQKAEAIVPLLISCRENTALSLALSRLEAL